METKEAKAKGCTQNKDRTTKVICDYCNRETDLVWVHGHFQCRLCKYVVESCCEGGEVSE